MITVYRHKINYVPYHLRERKEYQKVSKFWITGSYYMNYDECYRMLHMQLQNMLVAQDRVFSYYIENIIVEPDDPTVQIVDLPY